MTNFYLSCLLFLESPNSLTAITVGIEIQTESVSSQSTVPFTALRNILGYTLDKKKNLIEMTLILPRIR